MNTKPKHTDKTESMKTWKWNSAQVEAEQNHAKQVQAAQRRFRATV